MNYSGVHCIGDVAVARPVSDVPYFVCSCCLDFGKLPLQQCAGVQCNPKFPTCLHVVEQSRLLTAARQPPEIPSILRVCECLLLSFPVVDIHLRVYICADIPSSVVSAA